MSGLTIAQPISSVDLQYTRMVAHPEAEIIPGRNTVYCASFQLTWNVLVDEIIKTPLKLEGNPS
jgi:hypothetical protein